MLGKRIHDLKNTYNRFCVGDRRKFDQCSHQSAQEKNPFVGVWEPAPNQDMEVFIESL